MSEPQRYDLAIVGGGPGGYVAAIRAAQLGIKSCLIEKGRIGGVCLNWGCIPTKALLKSAEVYELCGRAEEFGVRASKPSFDMKTAVKRSRQISEQVTKGVEYLLKQHRIAVIPGRGHIVGPHRVAVFDPGDEPVAGIEAQNIIVATGARPRSIPGIRIDGVNIISSTEAMMLDSVPESIVIVGAGAVGVEFAYFFNAVGSKVTLLEMLPSVLPGEDAEISKLLARFFKKQGIEIVTSAKVESVEVRQGGVRAAGSASENVPDNGNGDRARRATGDGAAGGRAAVKVVVKTENGVKEIEASKVLMAAGVVPNSSGLGLEDLGVAFDKGGFIETDELMRTSAEGIYAVGDVAGPPLLAHVASAQGILSVETIAGKSPKPLKMELMPRCVYCRPQVASVGLSEERAIEWAKACGKTVRVGRFPFRASGKSVAVGERDGIVKIVAEAENGRILGAAIIGGEATELLAEIGLAQNLDATCEQILSTVHAHPTLSEAVMEAAGDAMGMAIHKPADGL